MAELSFQEAEKIIRENPKQADALAFEYQEFLKTHPEISPVDIPQSVLDGKAISEAYYYLRDQHENSQMGKEGAVDQAKIPYELTTMPLLTAAFLQRPKILENDGDYKKITENLKKEWLKKNNAKDFTSKEGLDYLYGSLDDSTKNSLHKEAEEIFRKNPKFKNKIERYNKEAKKIYKNPIDDPRWRVFKQGAQMEINARLELLRKNRDKKTKVSKEGAEKPQQEIINYTNKKRQEEFAEKHPEKAKAYFKKAGEGSLVVNIEEVSVPQEGLSYTMNVPSPTRSQPEQPPFSSGLSEGVGQGTNVFNNIPGFRNPLGRVGSKVVGQTVNKGLAAFLAANPWVGITLGIIILFIVISIIVFAIVTSGVAPGAPPQQTITPPPAP